MVVGLLQLLLGAEVGGVTAGLLTAVSGPAHQTNGKISTADYITKYIENMHTWGEDEHSTSCR